MIFGRKTHIWLRIKQLSFTVLLHIYGKSMYKISRHCTAQHSHALNSRVIHILRPTLTLMSKTCLKSGICASVTFVVKQQELY